MSFHLKNSNLKSQKERSKTVLLFLVWLGYSFILTGCSSRPIPPYAKLEVDWQSVLRFSAVQTDVQHSESNLFFVVGASDSIVAISKESGKLSWGYDLGKKSDLRVHMYQLSFLESFVVFEKHVEDISTFPNKRAHIIVVIDGASGEVICEVNIPAQKSIVEFQTLNVVSSNFFFDGAGIWFLTDDGYINRIDTKSTLLERQNIEMAERSLIAAQGKRVVVWGTYGKRVELDASMIVQRQDKVIDGSRMPFIDEQGRVFQFSSSKGLVCLDIAGKRTVWNNPQVAFGTIYSGCSSEVLWVKGDGKWQSISKKTGTILKEFDYNNSADGAQCLKEYTALAIGADYFLLNSNGRPIGKLDGRNSWTVVDNQGAIFIADDSLVSKYHLKRTLEETGQ